MKNQTKTLALTLATLLSAFSFAYADNATPKPTDIPATHLTRREVVEKLQLTDAQRKQIRSVRAAYRISVAKLDSQIKLKKVQLENELDKPDTDPAKVDVLTADLGVLYGQRLNVKVKASIQLEEKILTPQQADMLKSMQVKESAASDEIL
jgi:Spy/CpxP family protein refolding chaperone